MNAEDESRMSPDQGESLHDDHPICSVDKPANRIEDIHGMADFISQYPGVDSTRIGLLGICGGGGYSLAAAETDKRFKPH